MVVIAESTIKLREHLSAFAIGKETTELISGQADNHKTPNIAFLFTGQGSQYLGMGRELYDTQPVFRDSLNLCNEILLPYLKKPLLEVLYPTVEESFLLNETAYTQPALFAVEYALFETWKSWGVKPSVVMGHSVGEYVAACVAGVFSLEDGLKLIAERGRLIQELPQDGEMVSVFASQEKIAIAIKPYEHKISIAALNGPQSIVISGQRSAICKVVATFEAEGVKTKTLKVSHAFHSPLMNSIVTEFERIASKITYSSPNLDIISNVTGQNITSAIATPEYWCHHLRQPVKFVESIEALNQQGYKVFVECGPKPTLLGMGRRCLQEVVGIWLPSLRQGKSAYQQMLESFGQLYVRGLSVDWTGFYRNDSYYRTALPTYPFQREKYWFVSDRTQVSTTLALCAEDSMQKAEKISSNIDRDNNEHNFLNEKVTQAPAAEKIQNIVSKISKVPMEKLNLKSQIHEDLGFDSLMTTELKTAIKITFPNIKELPFEILLGRVTVEQLVDYVSENKNKSLPSENKNLSQSILSSDLAKFQKWKEEFQPNKISRIEKHLVHKDQAENVFICRTEQPREDLIIGEVVQDIHHFFFYEHPRDHVPGLYIIEAARQLAISLSHEYYKVPLKMLFVVDELQTQFYKFAESNLPLFMIARIYDKVYADSLLKCMRVSIFVVQEEENIALVSGVFKIFDPVKYNSLRKEGKVINEN
ncbi:MAG: acyltransferase domain-containing protein [Pleurocapsa sp. CRU_1_2]|nr:acyltransferase domain-containing protein [Pleurocapsa sp. CRU_1_2]